MLNDVGPIISAIRNIFIIFDACIYYFVNFGFTMLFNIATFNIVDRKMIFDLVSRIQLIIGIFMLFQLAMTIIKGIVNPDSFTDSKNGAGNVIMRIIVSLVLLALLVPLNISAPKNEYEKQINNNGVLFGTLYSLQYRILTNDTLGKLILGDDSTNYTSSDPDSKSLDEFGNNFTTTVIKAFYTLNVDDEGNYVCNDGWDEVYKSNQITAHEIIINGTRTCGDDNWPSWAKTLYDLTPYGAIDGAIHDEKYSISMSYITCTIVGIVLLVLLCMMIFNVAIRVFKLVALQLLAPIPVISYMDPKGSKDNAFSSWLKLLGTTYLELFIQLGVIYFAISIIRSFMERFPELSLQTVVDTTSTGAIQGPVLLRWTFIIMTIALFIFAKDAPKFFKQMLGVKDDGKGFFGAFGTAMGFGVAAVGAIGSFNANRQASRDADIARAKNYAKQRGWNEQQTENYVNSYAGRLSNRAKHGLSGLFGAGLGLAAGSAAASESKGNGLAKTMASINAMNSRNTRVRAAGRDGGTFFGGIASLGQEVMLGQNEYDRLEADWKAREQVIKNQELELKPQQDDLKRRKDLNARKEAVITEVKSKVKDCKVTKGNVEYTSTNGQTIKLSDENYYEFHSRVVAAQSQGDNVTTDATTGQKIWHYKNMDIDLGLLDILDNEVLKENEKDFYLKVKNDARDVNGKLLIDNQTISGEMQAYVNEAGHPMEDNFTNLKIETGRESRAIKEKNVEIANKLQKLNEQKAKINDEKQGYEGQRAAANKNKFRSGKNGG